MQFLPGKRAGLRDVDAGPASRDHRKDDAEPWLISVFAGPGAATKRKEALSKELVAAAV